QGSSSWAQQALARGGDCGLFQQLGLSRKPEERVLFSLNTSVCLLWDPSSFSLSLTLASTQPHTHTHTHTHTPTHTIFKTHTYTHTHAFYKTHIYSTHTHTHRR